MKIKKIIFLSLFIIIALLFIPNTVKAVEVTDTKGITWTYDLQNGEAINVKPKDKNTLPQEITIPNTLNESQVTSIGDEAFYLCTSLTSITIPDSVTKIGNCAFQNCFSLQEIIIPDKVTSIGNSVFNNCTSLTSITIPDTVTTIGNYSFAGCDALTNITIPEKVTTIGDYAFAFCDLLTSITIPNSVTSIGKSVFSVCPNLKSIKIPKSVVSIGDYIIRGSGGENPVIIYGYQNSEAENYALNNKLDVKFIKLYTVTLNITEGANIFIKDRYITSTSVEEIEEGAEIKITAKKGYKIKSIKVNDIEQTLTENNILTITNIAEEQNVVIETEKIYKVIFDANGGTFASNDEETLVFDDWQSDDYIDLEKPTRDGYEFLGYYTEKEEGTSFDHYYNESGVDQDMTLYARWKKIETTFENIEGSASDTPIPQPDGEGAGNAAPAPIVVPTTTPENKPTSNNPQTGDNIWLFVGVLVISVVGILVTIKFNKTVKK